MQADTLQVVASFNSTLLGLNWALKGKMKIKCWYLWVRLGPCSLAGLYLLEHTHFSSTKADETQSQSCILVRFSSSVSTLHWYIHSITVWSRAARRWIRFSSYFNNYKSAECSEKKAQHREGFVKLTDNNKQCVVWFCIHSGIIKSNCPWKKKQSLFPIQNTSHSLGPNLYFWSWMQMNKSLHRVSGCSDSNPEQATKTCSRQTSSTRQRGLAGFSLWDLSAF